MIVYQQAFDLYHTMYRMIILLSHFKYGDYVEIDRLRIWDYYLLYPNKMALLKLRNTEKDIKTLIRDYIVREKNPYELVINDRKMFEKIKPYQLTAIKCLASHGIVNKDYLSVNRVTPVDKAIFEKYSDNLRNLSVQEKNAISLLTSHFYKMALGGDYGLKHRSSLLESKYDAQ